jgi:hypothetical protein
MILVVNINKCVFEVAVQFYTFFEMLKEEHYTQKLLGYIPVISNN